METCEVRIDVAGDHLSHISRLSPLRYRVQEDIVRVYYGRPQEECEVRGDKRGVAARACVMHTELGGAVTMVKRMPLQACMFEWFTDMRTLLSRRVTYMVTHCVQVHVDALEDGSAKTTVVWVLSGQDTHQRARVDDLLERLGDTTPRSEDASMRPGVQELKDALDSLKGASAWTDR